MKKLILISALLFSFNISAISPINIDHDEFKKYSWMYFEEVPAQKYYQEANVYVFFGIGHSWWEEGIDDDHFSLILQGNVAFKEANEDAIFFIDNYGDRVKYANAWNSKYQKGETPYGYRMGVGCPGVKPSNCLDYFKKMQGKKIIWRFYNGQRKIADLEIPIKYRDEVIEYFEKYKTNYK